MTSHDYFVDCQPVVAPHSLGYSETLIQVKLLSSHFTCSKREYLTPVPFQMGMDVRQICVKSISACLHKIRGVISSLKY